MHPGRVVPPSAPPLQLRSILRGFRAAIAPRREAAALADTLRSHFRTRYAFLVSSGKAALSLILRSLNTLSGRRTVVVPAYTCFSVPASVLAAGLELTACDIDPETLDFDYGELERRVGADTLAIVATHLLGLPARMETVRAMGRRVGAFIVEDAAQAMGGCLDGRPLGTWGDVGFFSLGRGKMLTCGEGGIVLTDSVEIGEALSREIALLGPAPGSHVARSLLALCAQRVFTHPGLYWIPDGVPALGLGRTVYPGHVPMSRFPDANAAILARWPALLADTVRIHRRNARTLAALLCARGWLPAPPSAASLYLRLPVRLERPEDKARLCAESKQRGLGISPMYPTPISAIPEIHDRFGGRIFPGATAVAERLVTLPVHRLVRPPDYERILAAFQRVLGPAGGLQVIAPHSVAHPSPQSV